MTHKATVLAAVSSILFGCVSTPSSQLIYQPDLGARALGGDREAFQQILNVATDTPPGEQLEEMAYISSKFLVLDVNGFLTAQGSGQGCFGADFLGPEYTDNTFKSKQELLRRIELLDAVQDDPLRPTAQTCADNIRRALPALGADDAKRS